MKVLTKMVRKRRMLDRDGVGEAFSEEECPRKTDQAFCGLLVVANTACPDWMP